MENITGTRFGTQHNNNIESYRGSSVVVLRDGDPESSRTWKTTNQVRRVISLGMNKNTQKSILACLLFFWWTNIYLFFFPFFLFFLSPLQIFSECALVSDTIGLSNQGISSQVARDMHKKQGLYRR